MAAPTLVQVMTGIETQLKTITGLRTAPFKPDQVNPPQAFVSLPHINYHEAFRHGTMSIAPVVTVLYSRSLDRTGQPGLSTYMDIAGANSVHAAIEADRTLGGLSGVDCIVVDAQEGDIELGGIAYYGAVFNLKVTASGA